jgi:hypothetical protein
MAGRRYALGVGSHPACGCLGVREQVCIAWRAYITDKLVPRCHDHENRGEGTNKTKNEQAVRLCVDMPRETVCVHPMRAWEGTSKFVWHGAGILY